MCCNVVDLQKVVDPLSVRCLWVEMILKASLVSDAAKKGASSCRPLSDSIVLINLNDHQCVASKNLR